MMDAKRYYAILDVDPMCSDEDIRTAFRRRAKELHPDSESGSAADFILLKRAYDTLVDPLERARYDRQSRPKQRRPFREEPLFVPRPRRYRAGGMSVGRFVGAFLFMAGLSAAAVEVILADANVPLTSLFTPTPPAPASDPAATKALASPPVLVPAAEDEPLDQKLERLRRFEALQPGRPLPSN